MKKSLLFTLISASFLMNACTYTDYEHIDPPSREGKVCVADCEYERQVCLTQKQRAEQNMKRRYDDDMYYYERCIERQRQTKNWSTTCTRPTNEFVQGYDCKRIYDACFKACGGQIREVEKQL